METEGHIGMIRKEVKQEQMFALSPSQIEELKVKLANFTIEYLNLEEKKKDVDANFSEQMKEIWAEITAIKKQLD